MDNVVGITDNQPHFNYYALCISCGNTWIATCHYQTNPFKLECPNCGEQKSFCSHVDPEREQLLMEDGGG